MKRGEINADVKLFLDANSRTPDANMGDIRAMLAALSAGERRVAQVVAQYGAVTLVEASGDLIAYADAKARDVIATLPQGTYAFSDYLDDDAVSRLPVRIALALTVGDGTIHLDFTGTDPQVAAAMNVPSRGRPHAWLTLRILALVHVLTTVLALQ